MSVLIRGMEMPKDCTECLLAVPVFNYARNEYVSICQLENSIGCPLVEVSTPHGRLIDADKLKENYPNTDEWNNYVHYNNRDREIIDNAPTVVESEE